MDSFIKETTNNVRVQAPICDRQIVTEISSDFSLPDYQPEMKRLLRVRATVSPPDKYIGVGNAEFSGTVDYAILYCGNDGALYCANETADYQFSVPVEMTSDFELNEGLTCDADIVADMTVGRVAAPRKISVKCRLRSRVRLWGTKLMGASIAPDGKGRIERLYGNAEAARLFVGQGEPLTLEDEILTDAADLRVISADGHVFVNEATTGSGVINCRGEVCLKLLCCREGSEDAPTVMLRRIPFTQAVTTDGAEVNCEACADGVASDLRVTVEEGRILCEATLKLRARAQRNESISLIRDLYSTEVACKTQTQQYVLPLALRALNGNFSLNTTLTLEEAGLRSGLSLIDICMTPLVTDLIQENGKCYLIGKCRAQAVMGDREEILSQEFEVPFRYECDCPKATVCDYDASVEVFSCRAKLDAERIALDSELAVCLTTRSESRFEMLSDVQFGEPFVRTGACYTVCYPSREDTLWSVAKRYHRSVESISEQNNLAGSPAADSADSLSGIHFLFV